MTRERLSALVPWFALAASILLVGSFNSTFLKPATLIGLSADSATLFLMALGMTWVLYLGSIDLSLQSVAAVSSVVLAQLIPGYGFLAIVAALAAGLAFGLLSGYVHGVLKLPSFIATLAVGGIATTTALALSNQRSIQIDALPRSHTLGWAIGVTSAYPTKSGCRWSLWRRRSSSSR